MQARNLRRLERVKQAVMAMPIRHEVLTEEYEFFRCFGELPEEQNLAQAVTRWALYGEEVARRPIGSGKPGSAEFAILLASALKAPKPSEPSTRQCLYGEAVYGDGLVQRAARAALTIQSAHGADVTSPTFLADVPLPKVVTVGLHLLGYPEKLAIPPYEDQAHRLFERFEELKERIDYDDEAWLARSGDALDLFVETGELPKDPLMRDVVLADTEMNALFDHKRGHDRRQVMALLDRVATTTGRERQAAIAEIQAGFRGDPVVGNPVRAS